MNYSSKQTEENIFESDRFKNGVKYRISFAIGFGALLSAPIIGDYSDIMSRPVHIGVSILDAALLFGGFISTAHFGSLYYTDIDDIL